MYIFPSTFPIPMVAVTHKFLKSIYYDSVWATKKKLLIEGGSEYVALVMVVVVI